MSVKHPDPTPRQILLRKRELQAGWTPTQEWMRAGKPKRTWTPPVTLIDELADVADEWCADSTEDLTR